MWFASANVDESNIPKTFTPKPEPKLQQTSSDTPPTVESTPDDGADMSVGCTIFSMADYSSNIGYDNTVGDC